MRAELKRLLEHLAQILVGRRQEEIESLHRRALSWQAVPRLPLIFEHPLEKPCPFTLFPHREALDDPEKMLHNELVSAWGTSPACRDLIGDDLPLTIRADFGTVLIPSMFGAQVEQVGDNPPWVRHDEKTQVRLEGILDVDPTDMSRGWLERAAARYRYYCDALNEFPLLGKLVRLTLPDLQGPIDSAELILGEELFIQIALNGDLVRRALERIAEAQIAAARFFQTLSNDGPDGFSHQHGFVIRGGILLRCDTALMVSPSMYREYAAPADIKVLAEFGGGVHSCGRVDNIIGEFLRLPRLDCFDFGQSWMNDMDTIYSAARRRRIGLVRVHPDKLELETASILQRFPTGMSLWYRAASIDEARRIMDRYLEASSNRSCHGLSKHEDARVPEPGGSGMPRAGKADRP